MLIVLSDTNILFVDNVFSYVIPSKEFQCVSIVVLSIVCLHLISLLSYRLSCLNNAVILCTINLAIVLYE